MEKDVFATRIKEARESCGLLQKDLAGKIGIKQQTLSGYEKGKMKPPIDTVKAIANTCNVSLDWLCGMTEKKNNSKIKTYKDFILFFMSFQKDYKNIVSIGTIRDDFGTDLPAIAFNDKTIESVFAGLEKMQALLLRGDIDNELFELWVEKQLAKTDKPIDKNYISEPLPF